MTYFSKTTNLKLTGFSFILFFLLIAAGKTYGDPNRAPIFVGGARQSLAVCQSSGANAINTELRINDSDVAQTETWTLSTAPLHGSASVSFSATSTGSVIVPSGLTYAPTGGYSGLDSFVVTISDGVASSTTTIVVTVTALPNAGTISGPSSVCVGSGITLTTTGTGGSWSATNGHALALSTGVVGGISAGLDTIQYTVTNSCGTSVASHDVTVGAPTSAGTVSGPTVLCTGATGTFSSTVSGGNWISSNSTIASINGGTGFTAGLTAGTVTITYVLTTACGSAVSTAPLTVSVSPSSGSISGPSSVCAGSAITLTDGVSGGSWSSSDITIASVNSSGSVTGIVAGSATISYVVTNSCGTATSTYSISVNPLPDPGTISGAPSVCPSATTTLTSTASGGVWSTSGASVASVNSSGVVTGVAAGTATITYTSTTVCGSSFTTATMTVNTTPNAGAITGGSVVCVGAGITLVDAASGGTWSSGNTAIASVDGSGNVTGTGVGTVTISYTVTTVCGTASATATVNVFAAPNPGTILGTTTICAASGTTLTSTSAGGVWSTASASVASINSASGAMTGVSAGSTTITYTVTTGCGTSFTTASVTVNPLPVAGTISGPTVVCVAASVTLSDAASGGVWSSGNNAIATVGASGGVTGVATGSVVISYSVTNSCGTANATYNVTVSNSASGGTISGPTNLCPSGSGALSSTVSGGTWSSSSASIVSINSGSGIMNAVSPGSVTITYTVTTGCSSATATYGVTVGSAPTVASISGPSGVCVGSSITLTDATSGGTWATGNAAIASVDGSGNVTGTGSGTVTISYSVTNACGTATVTTNITVSTPASAGTIGGSTTVCAGAASALSTSAPGGVWTIADATVASVNSSTGLLNGVAAGTTTVSYTVTTACSTASATAAVTVNPGPVAGTISGAAPICVGATLTLTDAAPGGSWSTSNAAIASVDATGFVTGVSAGTASISYSVTNGCGTANAIVSINVSNVASAGTISGTTTLCAGSATTLTTTGSGGSWSTTNAAIASVDASSGNVTAVAAGTVTISYVVTTGCSSAFAITSFTVNPLPAAGSISGPSVICETATTVFTDAASGGSWSSSNTATATVSTTGAVTGVASGSAVISYTVVNSCGTASATKNITVNPLAVAGTITGSTSVCIGATTALADATTGGVWSTSNASVASVTTSGLVFGRSAGTATISYSVTNSCGTIAATATVTVLAYPYAGVISGPGTTCIGATVTYIDTTPGGFWTTGNAAIATVDATGGVTGVSLGTVNIYYNMVNACGATNVTVSVNVLTAPSTSIITGTTSICPSGTSVLTDTVAGGTWSSSDATIATVAPSSGPTVTVTGLSVGTAVISYSTSNACGSALATAYMTISGAPASGSISGAASVCVGSSTLLTETVSGGIWNSSDTTIARVNATGLVTGVSAGTVVISYTVTGMCGVAVLTDTITVVPTATAPTITGSGVVCLSTTSTLTGSVSGGTWVSSNTAIVTVSTTGDIYGVALGTATVTYTVTGACGTASNTVSITVSSTPYEGLIVGSTNVCERASTTLTETVSGGTWSSGNPSIATVSTGGVVTGVAAGTATISYTIVTACGTGIATAFMTVGPLPDPGTITGGSVCLAGTSTFTASVSGGTWSTASATIASVNATGTVFGVALGTTTISYGVTNSCGTTYATVSTSVITAPTTAGIILGAGSPVCPGATIALTDTVAGGTWTTADAAIASIEATTGVVTGVAGGAVIITYTVSNACGSVTDTANVIVSPGPYPGRITGVTTTVCIGQTIRLWDTTAITTGSWSLSDTTVAHVDTTGVVHGLVAGTATLSYTITGSCGTATAVTLITVNPIPDAGTISGSTVICMGTTFTLVDTVSGGVWSSSDATVMTVSTTGDVTAIGAGMATISYSVTNVYGCTNAATVVDTVLSSISAGSITGITTTACEGFSFTLYDTTAAAAGVWSSADTTVAFISSTGVVSGRATGVTTVSYTVTASSGCMAAATVNVTVHPTPVVAAITGPTSLCTGGGTITLSDATTGGRWTSSNPSVATIDTASGVLTSVSIGTTMISYSITNVYGCTGSATRPDTVGAIPTVAAISGASTLCTGVTSVFTDATTGGTWTTSNASIASVDATGNVTGTGAGTAMISYTVGTGCRVTATHSVTVSVSPTVGAISGPSSVCAGSSITLTNATSGGTWSSSAITVATVNTTGDITGVSGGTATISYSVTSGTCSASALASVTVNPMPVVSAISGPAAMCLGTTITFTDTAAGGSWSTSDASVASVDAAGHVTAVAAGTAVITYTVTNACGTASATLTVNTSAGPSAGTITGTTTICAGATTTLADAAGGGTWMSSDTSVARISSTGVVTGRSGGTATISYIISSSCGTVFATTTMTIVALPSAGTIGGPTGVCLGSSITLSETVAGGTWSSSSSAIATVSTSGVVYGLTAGTVRITYTVTNGAGCTAFTTYTVGSGSSLTAAITPGGATLCNGTPVLLTVTSTSTGLSYQWYKNAILIAGATNSTYTATTAAAYAAIVTNGCAIDTTTAVFITNPPNPVITLVGTNTLSTGSFALYQWYRNGTPIPGATAGVYNYTTSGTYTVRVTDGRGCSVTSAGYVVTISGGGSDVATLISAADVSMFPNPASDLIQIEAPVKVNVTVTSADGKVMTQLNDATSIDVSKYPNAMYIIMVYDARNNTLIKTDKFIKMN